MREGEKKVDRETVNLNNLQKATKISNGKHALRGTTHEKLEIIIITITLKNKFFAF